MGLEWKLKLIEFFSLNIDNITDATVGEQTVLIIHENQNQWHIYSHLSSNLPLIDMDVITILKRKRKEGRIEY